MKKVALESLHDRILPLSQSHPVAIYTNSHFRFGDSDLNFVWELIYIFFFFVADIEKV